MLTCSEQMGRAIQNTGQRLQTEFPLFADMVNTDMCKVMPSPSTLSLYCGIALATVFPSHYYQVSGGAEVATEEGKGGQKNIEEEEDKEGNDHLKDDGDKQGQQAEEEVPEPRNEEEKEKCVPASSPQVL